VQNLEQPRKWKRNEKNDKRKIYGKNKGRGCSRTRREGGIRKKKTRTASKLCGLLSTQNTNRRIDKDEYIVETIVKKIAQRPEKTEVRGDIYTFSSINMYVVSCVSCHVSEC